MAEKLKGGCLCGGIRYEVNGAPEAMGYCHCSRCRKSGGASVGTFLALQADQLRVVQGSELLRTYRSEGFADRSFCSTCGSYLYAAGHGALYLGAGTLDGDPGVRPQVHVQVAYKAPWVEITDKLPQFPEYPPAE
jgi:hypothetical protein